MALNEYGLPEIRRRCPCEFGEIEPCSPNCTCRDHGQSGGCGRCCTYGSAEQKLDAARLLVQREGWQQRYEELKAAVLEMYRTQHPGSRDTPYTWALRESKKAHYKLKVLVGLLTEDKVPENLR